MDTSDNNNLSTVVPSQSSSKSDPLNSRILGSPLQSPNSPFQDNKVKIGLALSSLGLLLFLSITFIAPLKTTLFSLLYSKPSSHAQSQFPNDPVNSQGAAGWGQTILATNNEAYIGGQFAYTGPNTDGGVPLETATGNQVPNFPPVLGALYAAVPDGNGGWYVAGDFYQIADKQDKYVAHILSNMTVDPNFNFTADNPVFTIALSADKSILYIGGYFNVVNGTQRWYFASINATTGALNPVDLQLNDQVNILKLSSDGKTLYVGGDFTQANGQTRNELLAFDTNTQAITSWNPNVAGEVDSMTLSPDGSTLYIGGYFNAIGGQTRDYIGAISTTTGSATSWNPNPGAPSNSYVNAVMALAISPDGQTIYAAGWFATMGGQTRDGIAAIDAISGAVTSWNPDSTKTTGNQITSLTISADGSTLYVGGYFNFIGGQTRYNIASLSTSTAQATSWNPGSGQPGKVLGLSPDGSIIYAGFGQGMIGPPVTAVTNLVRMKQDGTIDQNFKPYLPGVWVKAMALSPDGSTLYVGGSLVNSNSQPQNLEAVNTSTGAVISWIPTADKEVESMAISSDGKTVYVAGQFTTINGQPRSGLAAIDAATGNLLPWNPNPNGTIRQIKISNDGSILYVTGTFTSIGGQSRPGLAAIETGTGNSTSWNPQGISTAFAEVISPDQKTIWVTGDFPAPTGTTPIFGLEAIDATTGQQVGNVITIPDFNFFTVWAESPDQTTLYITGPKVVGQFTQFEALALDTNTGNSTSWSPIASSTLDNLGLSPDGNTLYLTGCFSEINNKPFNHIAQFTLSAAPTPTPTPTTAITPTNTPTPTPVLTNTPTPTPGSGGIIPTNTPTPTPTPTPIPLTATPTPIQPGAPSTGYHVHSLLQYLYNILINIP